jgi:hypothetical protein
MVHFAYQANRGNQSLRALVDSSVRPVIAKRRPQRVLLLSNEPESLPGFQGLASVDLVALHAGSSSAADAVSCRSEALPFQDDSFEMVILHDVFADGSEPELAESERVLTGGGEIFVLGRGALGLAGRFGQPGSGLPRLQVGAVCRSLQAHSFRIEQCIGVGLAGMLVNCDRRWQQPALPFADAVLIQGRHRTAQTIVTPLRFGRPQTVGVQSTAADSFSREAV